MSAPRTGSLGALEAEGDLLVLDAGLDVERIPIGGAGQVLTSDGTTASWADIADLAVASLFADATDAIFKKITIPGPTLVDNPSTRVNGTHSLLGYAAASHEGIAWQRYMPVTYGGGDLKATIIWLPTTTTPAENVEWGVSLERDNAGVLITTDAFTAPAVTGVQAATTDDTIAVASTVTMVAGVATASIAAGDAFRLYVERDAGNGNDTYTAEAQLLRVILEEV